MKKNRLSELRVKKGYTKADVAIALNMTTSGITGIEKSEKISLDKGIKLSILYGVSIYDILKASKEFIEA
ncbi:TPA: helix-turn-helix transcriptional regulator [Clostridioides difficile]|uniref:helix-turn-helix transcriptional regulator n=1 Tax=Clostridioides difficile TaxID=1496 RepID=UPI0008257757|nr:helix-turn-helix transcriptional regulator [Clostridioides difficile]EKJ1811799.1 helix-turn-helix transcriptional regulator [Clostridioides difficile]MBZ0660724.1 helix-turn-helix transcriptional regulator [Clostridioides difficile]MCP8337801.1 helix-turn-helix transcriptional regulator [Clostridioides difficile]MCP8365841.1 helix-turn-helix transcriptional regulator [Clostridioides difficile]MCP8383297.1 helix-turn-helix transcriptional regulator [Clostridioides difficile]